MEEGNIKEAIKLIIESLTKKEELLFNEEIEESIKALVLSDLKIKDIERFHLYVEDKADTILKRIVMEMYPEVFDRQKLYNLAFVYRNYAYLKLNIENVLIENEGRSCCADKSRWIIKKYINYILSNEIPPKRESDDSYWMPRVGSGEQWVFFCNSLVKLYYGKPQDYIKALYDFKKT